MDFGDDPNSQEHVKNLLKDKENEIQILKKKLKILATQHIQTLELMSLQDEKDTIYREMLQYKEQVV